jgi:hypothetical protein
MHLYLLLVNLGSWLAIFIFYLLSTPSISTSLMQPTAIVLSRYFPVFSARLSHRASQLCAHAASAGHHHSVRHCHRATPEKTLGLPSLGLAELAVLSAVEAIHHGQLYWVLFKQRQSKPFGAEKHHLLHGGYLV